MNPAVARVLSDLKTANWNDEAAIIEADVNRLESENVAASDSLANLRTDHARAVAAEREAERERIGAILRHPEAANRRAQAEALAFETDLAPDIVATILKASPLQSNSDFLSIGSRAAGLAEFGASSGSSPLASTGPMERAVDTINRNVTKR